MGRTLASEQGDQVLFITLALRSCVNLSHFFSFVLSFLIHEVRGSEKSRWQTELPGALYLEEL